MRVTADFLTALAVATLVVTGMDAIASYLDRQHRRDMDERAAKAALSIYDVPLIGSCGKDRCDIVRAGR